MPQRQRPVGGVAAATAFYTKRQDVNQGLGQKKKEKRLSTDTLTKPRRLASGASGRDAGSRRAGPESASNDVGFKSPRSIELWKQRKLEMAGIVTELEPWEYSKNPWPRTVTTPAPIPRREFNHMSLFELQKFEQWHDRHPHLDYPTEIPDRMFYHRKGARGGKGPIPFRDDKGVMAARAYGGKLVQKLPELRRNSTTRSQGAVRGSFSLTNGVGLNPSALGQSAFLNVLFQDVGSGDGSWLYSNPRVLKWLPYELLRAEQYFHLTSTLTNLHFLLKKSQGFGVTAVRYDLQCAEKAFKRMFHSGRCYEVGVPMETLLDWQARLKSYKNFFEGNIQELAANPVTIFRLGADSQKGGHVHTDVQGAVLQAEHSIGVIHTMLDPLQSSDADTVNNIPRLLTARKFLEVVREHGVWLAMDSTALDRISLAEKRANNHLKDFRERLQEVPEAIDRVGQVLLRGPAGHSEHWEKDSAFVSLTELFGDSFFGYEPRQAFANFSVDGASMGLGSDNLKHLLLEQLAENIGLDQEHLKLTLQGDHATLRVNAHSQNGGTSFEAPPAREIARRVMQDACDPESDLRSSGLVSGGPAPPTFWHEACIFITSTVADMQPERDMLSRFVLPALKLVCRRRRLRLSWVMCGADTPANLHNNLTWIKRSTLLLPDGTTSQFSLAIMGSKVGWIPGQEVRMETVRQDPSLSWVMKEPFCNWSQTQLEICQGQLREKEARGFIFVRDPTFVHSEAFQQTSLQVQDIFLESSPEAKDLEEEFKTYITHQHHLTQKKDACIFEYKTVFVDGEVQDSTGPGVRVSFSGLFSFGLDVYSALYKMIDSTHPICLSSQPELCKITKEQETAREQQLQMHAESVVEGTRTLFITHLCDFVFDSKDDILVALDGPVGSGRTCILANVCLRARQEQALRLKTQPDNSFVFAWVIHEPWHTEFDWLYSIAAQVCRRDRGTYADEFVGEVSLENITSSLWDMMTRGISVLLIIDGINEDEQLQIGRMFNLLQARSNSEWFGDTEKKDSLGRLRIIISTHGFASDMHRRVQILHVPELELEERLRICWSYVMTSQIQLPTKALESICGSKIGASNPRYLKVAMTFLNECQCAFPGQLLNISKELSSRLDTLYENDVIPFLENLYGAQVLSSVCAWMNVK
jgi:hypothetical protein